MEQVGGGEQPDSAANSQPVLAPTNPQSPNCLHEEGRLGGGAGLGCRDQREAGATASAASAL